MSLLAALPESTITSEFLTPRRGQEPKVGAKEENNISSASLRALREKIGNNASFHLFPFPEFTESGLRDYMGRGVEESLNAVRFLTGMELPVVKNPAADAPVLGLSFWQALIRGGYQGAVYYIDSLRAANE